MLVYFSLSLRVNDSYTRTKIEQERNFILNAIKYLIVAPIWRGISVKITKEVFHLFLSIDHFVYYFLCMVGYINTTLTFNLKSELLKTIGNGASTFK